MSITRRVFFATARWPSSARLRCQASSRARRLARSRLAERNKRLVVIFQRGAADGLNIVVPHAEPQYYAMRPSINIPRKSVIDLNGFFGLHPSLSAFQPLWQQGHLAIVHAAGSPDTTRSHFDAQDFMETGTPGVKVTEDGWLNRSLHSLPIRRREILRFAPLPWDRPCRAFLSGSSPPSP